MTTSSPRCSDLTLWHRIIRRLDQGLPDWRSRVESWEQVSAVAERRGGKRWLDDDVFRGFVLALLSNNTNWVRVEAVRDELPTVFAGWSLQAYARLHLEEVDRRIVPWFLDRRVGSPTLRQRLRDLVGAAQNLCDGAMAHGSVELFFDSLGAMDDGPKQLALALATKRAKLPGFGLPLAAEGLKNIGHDVAKPDRHVNRATAMFGRVTFRRWPERGAERFAAPIATTREALAVMDAVEALARAVHEPVALVDNAIWLLCAASGLHLANEELRELAGGETSHS